MDFYKVTLPKVFDTQDGKKSKGLIFKPLSSLFDGSVRVVADVVPYDNDGAMFVSFVNAYKKLLQSSNSNTGYYAIKDSKVQEVKEVKNSSVVQDGNLKRKRDANNSASEMLDLNSLAL